MENIILHMLGYFIIFTIIDYKRDEKSKIKPWSNEYFLILLGVCIAGILIKI